MLYNPVTRDLFTNENIFLKKLYCPHVLDWDIDFSHIEGSNNKHCEMCDKTIIDTISLSDSEIEKMIHNDPELCVKLELDQENIRVTIHNNEEN